MLRGTGGERRPYQIKEGVEGEDKQLALKGELT